MASEDTLAHAGQCEERELGLQKVRGCAHGDVAIMLGYQTTTDPPRQDAIGWRGPSKRRSSAPPQLYAVPRYYFSPLPLGSIRLLRLMPHPDQHASIQCQLFNYLLDDSLLDSWKGTHLYEALSYVWGSQDRRRSILIDESYLHVTENLHAALLRLRDRSLPRIVWVDAICIDQDNNEERNLQVQLMAKIYARASRVIVWLEEATAGGNPVDREATTNGDRALEVIGNAAAHGRSTEVPRDDLDAVLELLQRSWFRRIWVLQEVAAARHVVIISRTMEIDGYAFCSGFNVLNLALEEPGTQSHVHATAYLIKDAALRPKHATSHSDRFSLHIRPLGELIDMYHDRKASDLRDKVYALLGMSSDFPVGITPDYSRKWNDLFYQVVKSLVGEQAIVKTWDKGIAIIKTKGCLLGRVSKKYHTRGDGQRVDIAWKSNVGMKGEQSSQFTFTASVKPVQVGDAVCLLQGVSKPTIVRICNDYSAIIMVAVPLTEDSQPTRVKWSKLLQSITAFPNDILLVWDWDVSQGKSRDGGGYERFICSREGPECSTIECKCQDYMDKAIRFWNFGLLLNVMERYKEAGKNLRKAVGFYGTAVGKSHSAWGDADEETLRVMDFLLIEDRGAAIEAQCEDGQTPLSWAAGNRHEAVVQLLLNKGADVDVKDNNGRTPLSLAAGNADKAIVQLLLNKGAHFDNKFGRTLLLWAAENGHEAVVRLLLNRGFDIDFKDNFSDTPLSLAAWKGHKAVVQLLLDKGADINNNYSEKPLLRAARNGQETVVQLLLDRGVDIDVKNEIGQTPLSWAAKNGHEAFMQLLLNKGTDINTKDNNGRTPLSWAAEYGHEAIMRLLLDKGADIDVKDNNGRTPLSWAAEYGREAIMRLLLDKGADIDVKVNYSPILLSRAAGYRHEAVVRLLLDKGADIDIKDNNGWTPLSWATANRHKAVVKILQTYTSTTTTSVASEILHIAS